MADREPGRGRASRLLLAAALRGLGSARSPLEAWSALSGVCGVGAGRDGGAQALDVYHRLADAMDPTCTLVLRAGTRDVYTCDACGGTFEAIVRGRTSPAYCACCGARVILALDSAATRPHTGGGWGNGG